MKTHQMSKTRQYRIWKDMHTRCNNPSYRLYKDYGGRGVKVCKRWNSFENFWEDMQDGYLPTLTIDRINNNRGYSKENCRWADRYTQNRNRRMFKLSSQKVQHIRKEYAKGNYGIGKLLAEKYNVSPSVISEIVNKKRNYASI